MAKIKRLIHKTKFLTPLSHPNKTVSYYFARVRFTPTKSAPFILSAYDPIIITTEERIKNTTKSQINELIKFKTELAERALIHRLEDCLKQRQGFPGRKGWFKIKQIEYLEP